MIFTKKQIEFMRADINSNFGYTKLEMATRERLKEEGRDFDKEYEKWQQESRK